jgi:hypothetical protein
MRGSRMISMLEFAPRTYDSPGVVEAFLRSIESKS